MFSSRSPAVRRRRGASAVGALVISGALLLSPMLTAAIAAPEDPAPAPLAPSRRRPPPAI